jgi:RNA polymerase sigma factor (sigma-70 family)
MNEGHTTAAVQKYLDALAGDASAEPIVRALLARSANRLQGLSAHLLYRSYPRLARPPLNLHDDELLGAVVERLMKAMRTVRPGNVRQFFALANQHIRWELNDLARRLDEQPRAVELVEAEAPSSPSSVAAPSPSMRRMLDAIERLPEEERETFSLVRIQGMTHDEAAGVLGVSTKTVQRRVNRSRLLLLERLSDLGAAGGASSAISEA